MARWFTGHAVAAFAEQLQSPVLQVDQVQTEPLSSVVISGTPGAWFGVVELQPFSRPTTFALAAQGLDQHCPIGVVLLIPAVPSLLPLRQD